MSLIACESIHEGHEWFSDDSRGRQDIFVFGCSIQYVSNFADSRLKVPIYRSSQSYFCLSVFSSSKVNIGKITSIRSKLPTAACWSREKKRDETVKPTYFTSKATSVPDITDKSFTVFFVR